MQPNVAIIAPFGHLMHNDFVPYLKVNNFLCTFFAAYAILVGVRDYETNKS